MSSEIQFGRDFHWAQIAALFRLHGFSDKFHDFLFSPGAANSFANQARHPPKRKWTDAFAVRDGGGWMTVVGALGILK